MKAALLSAFANGAILSAALTVAISLVLRLTGRRFWNASTRYIVWVTALLITIFLPLLLGPIHSIQVTNREQGAVSNRVDLPATGSGVPVRSPQVPATTEIAPDRASFAEPVQSTQASAPSHRTFYPVEIPTGSWLALTGGVWIVTSVLMLLRLFVSYVMLQRRKERSLSIPGVVSDRVPEWLRLCGSRRVVRLAASGEIAAPIAAGPFRPSILIPARLLQELKDDEVDQIGLHEAAHLSRYDDYGILFQRICEAIFVFHPIVRWITRRMDLEREIACDDFVIQVTGRPRSYAQCLTKVVELAGGVSAPPLAAPATATRSVLERRLDMLLDTRRTLGARVLKLRLAIIVVMLGVAAGMMSAGPRFVLFAAPSVAPPVEPLEPVAVTVPAAIPLQTPSPAPVPAAQKNDSQPPVDREIAMGRELAGEVERTVKLIEDPVVNEFVNAVGQNLVRNSDAKVPFTIKVVDSPDVNAYALPGGFFYIDSGLILTTDNEAELAGIMAHLIAHVNARHGAEAAQKGQLLNVARIPLVLVGGPAGFAFRQANGLLIPFSFLSFSRKAETEADYLGLQYMFKAGYDPAAFAHFFEELQAKEIAKPGTIERSFASHPATPDRMELLRKNIGIVRPDRQRYILTTPDFEEVKTRLSRGAPLASFAPPAEPAQAPVDTLAELGGTITDAAGVALPSVPVSIRDAIGGMTRTGLTNEAGMYRFRLLPPATYEVTAKLTGLRTESYSAVPLISSQHARLDIILHYGSGTNSTSAVPLLSTLPVENQEKLAAAKRVGLSVSRVRVGEDLMEATLIQRVAPVYPPEAKEARVQGVVVLEILIGADGKVSNVKVIAGPPVLIQAAVDAVKQWTYKPTMLAGQTVEAVTTVTVSFP